MRGSGAQDDGDAVATIEKVRAPMAALPDPPPRQDAGGTIAGPAGAFPVWLTPLVGRERDVEHLLAARELEVLRLLAERRTDPGIARRPCISRRTVATHVRHIYGKLGVSSRAEAAVTAIRRGLARG